jgi:cell division protein ZapB
MISEFHQLIEKVGKLAELARTLRRENAELRLNLAALTAENADLSKRMLEAHERVSTLLDKIPALEQDEEAA